MESHIVLFLQIWASAIEYKFPQYVRIGHPPSHTIYIKLFDLHVGVPLILSGPQTDMWKNNNKK